MIYLSIRKKYTGLGTKRIERFTEKVLDLLKLTRSDLGLVLTSDKDIRRYNRKYLKHDRPTDVLAFGYSGGNPGLARGFRSSTCPWRRNRASGRWQRRLAKHRSGARSDVTARSARRRGAEPSLDKEKRGQTHPYVKMPAYLGDVMVSVDRAKIQSKQYGNGWKEELELYILHGILHLLGYDDQSPHDRLRMRKKEQDVLKRIRRK